MQTWYGLSDYEVENQLNDRISFMKFCGLRFEDDVPDHSVIGRFRKELTEKKAYEKLLNLINQQLEKHSILVKQGSIIDASITPTERKPKGNKTFEITNETPPKLKPLNKTGVDEEASWTKKSGKLHYGYKKHYLKPLQNGGFVVRQTPILTAKLDFCIKILVLQRSLFM